MKLEDGLHFQPKAKHLSVMLLWLENSFATRDNVKALRTVIKITNLLCKNILLTNCKLGYKRPLVVLLAGRTVKLLMLLIYICSLYTNTRSIHNTWLYLC